MSHRAPSGGQGAGAEREGEGLAGAEAGERGRGEAGERGRGELVQDSIQNNTFYLVVKPLVSFSREQLFSLSLRNVKGVKNIDYLCI